MTIQSVHAEFFLLLSTHYLLQREVDATAAVDYRFDSVGCIDVDIVGHLSFSFLLMGIGHHQDVLTCGIRKYSRVLSG